MDEAALRDWVRKSLSIQAIPDEVWQDLEAHGFIKDALDPEYRNGKAALKKEAERLLNFMRLGRARPSPPGRSRSKEHRPFLSQKEEARAQASSVNVARQAATTGLVRSFRRDILQGAVVSQEQVLAFLDSPAACVLSQEQFATYGIPLFAHHAQCIDTGGDFPNPYAVLRIEWAGGTIQNRFEPTRIVYGRYTEVMLEQYPSLYFLDNDQNMQHICPWPGSILSDLAKVSRDLAQRYLGLWTEDQATMFLLTGEPPFIAPLQVGIQSRACSVNDAFREADEDPRVFMEAPRQLSLIRPQITLTVDAWVSDKTVLRAYQSAQREVLKRDNHLLENRGLALGRFVVELKNWWKMTWDEQMTAWNKTQTNPAWKYADVRHFREAFRRVQQALCFPQIPLQNGARRKRQPQPRAGKR